MILSLDMSLRSTGWVILGYDGSLVDFGIIKTKAKDKDKGPGKYFDMDEDLIEYVSGEVYDIVNQYAIEQFVIEGLSFNGKNPKKDVIAGMYWRLRIMIRNCYPKVLIGSVPVTTWRSKFVPKKEMDAFKKSCIDSKKSRLVKQAVFDKLPEEVKKAFLLYVEKLGVDIDSVFDITDAYGLAIYRNSLNK